MANENRLIHGDVAEQRLVKLAEHYKGSFSGEAFERAAREIASMPRVDAVEVVRCKDCKHRADALDCGNYLCNRKMIGMVRPEDFCSFGERKDNGTTQA